MTPTTDGFIDNSDPTYTESEVCLMCILKGPVGTTVAQVFPGSFRQSNVQGGGGECEVGILGLGITESSTSLVSQNEVVTDQAQIAKMEFKR